MVLSQATPPITQHSLKGWQDPQYLSSLAQTSPGSKAASLSLLRRESRCQLTGESSALRERDSRMLGATAVWQPMWRVAQSCSMACGSMVSCPGAKGVLVQKLLSIYLSTDLLSIHPFTIHPSTHPSSLPSFHPPSTYLLSTHPSIFPCIRNSSIHHPPIYSSILSSFHPSSIHCPTQHSSMCPSCLPPIVHPPIHLPFIYLSFYPSVYPCMEVLSCPPIDPIIYPILCPFTHPSNNPSVHPPPIHPFSHPFLHPPTTTFMKDKFWDHEPWCCSPEKTGPCFLLVEGAVVDSHAERRFLMPRQELVKARYS